VTAKLSRFVALAGVVVAAGTLAACGEFVRDGRAPARLIVDSLQGASGADPGGLGTTLSSDVLTIVTTGGTCSDANPCPTRFNDVGQVSLRIQLRDIGSPTSPATPSPLNAVTINRYHVQYRRSDGRNAQGVDVPFAFDSAMTFTVPESGSASGGFDLVRNIAKREAPLAALESGDTMITTIADVTFYGRDQAGNDVSVTGSIGVTFGNFADPE
jgi:hypothetical protein